MPCDCDIAPTVNRLIAQGRIKGDLTILPILLSGVDLAEKDDFAFEDHMRLEDDLIRKFLPPDRQVAMTVEHKLIRAYRAKGLIVPQDLFDQHKAWEKSAFKLVGR